MLLCYLLVVSRYIAYRLFHPPVGTFLLPVVFADLQFNQKLSETKEEKGLEKAPTVEYSKTMFFLV